MDHKDLVSIIMPVYNGEDYLPDAVESILKQTYPHWELLLIDDGSTDQSQALARAYGERDKRISCISLPQNGGVARARNAGIKQARGRFIAFCDSDDSWLPEKLEKQIVYMKGHEAAISCTSYCRYSKESEKATRAHLVTPPLEVDYSRLLEGNSLGCLTVMIDTHYIAKSKIAFRQIHHEDYALWLDLLRQGWKAYGLQEDLASYHVHKQSLSANKWKSLLWTWQIYRHEEGLPLGKALTCFGHYIKNGIYKRA